MGRAWKTGRRSGRRGTGRRGKRKPSTRDRVGTTRRQWIVVAAALTIPAGLVVSVRRSAQGTRLAEQIEDLRRETRLLEEALAEEVVRVDSLSSRDRIGRVATRLGLRLAREDEVVVLGDVTQARDHEVEGS
ncbi:MAG: hypothetical protein PVF05_12990 [Gemmatimonadales bacterium]|jgi:hypothetical protein